MFELALSDVIGICVFAAVIGGGFLRLSLQRRWHECAFKLAAAEAEALTQNPRIFTPAECASFRTMQLRVIP